MKELSKSSISEIKGLIQKKEIKCAEVAEYFVNETKGFNPKCNAIIELNERAIEQAKELDSNLGADKKLFGIPFFAKDMFCIEGNKTEACSNILKNYKSPFTATCINKILNEGGLLLGRCNQDEFAMGSSNEFSSYGPCKNPQNLEYVPGGSSGGSAAAVAAGFSPFSLGTDTGGSIRQPAHFCGVVGFKPTYGRVSRYGIVAFASSLDQAGPITRNVEDAELVAKVMSGHDKFDSTSSRCELWNEPDRDKKLKVGVINQLFDVEVESGVREALEKQIENLKKENYEIVEIDLPHISYSVPVYYLLATSEASSNLSRYDGVRYGHRYDFGGVPANSIEEFYSKTRDQGFGAEVKRRLALGTFALSAGFSDEFYSKAAKVRRIIANEFYESFKTVDAMIAPVSTESAFKLGDRTNDPIKMYNNDLCTIGANLAGLPAISVPVGKDKEGLPIGLQIISNQFEESKLFSLAYKVEELSEFRYEVSRGL